VTLVTVRRGIEHFESVLGDMDDGAVENGLNRRLHHLTETEIHFVSARPEEIIDGLFRAASPQPGFEFRVMETVADLEAHIDSGVIVQENCARACETSNPASRRTASGCTTASAMAAPRRNLWPWPERPPSLDAWRATGEGWGVQAIPTLRGRSLRASDPSGKGVPPTGNSTRAVIGATVRDWRTSRFRASFG